MDGAAATLAAVTSVAIGALALIEGDVPLADPRLRPGRRLPRLPALQPRLARAHLPRRRRQPADRLRGGGRADGAARWRPSSASSTCSRPCCSPAFPSSTRRSSRSRGAAPASRSSPAGATTSPIACSTRLGTARTVALTLGVVQAGLGAIAIGVVQLGRGSVLAAWSIWFVVAAAAIVLLESRVLGAGARDRRHAGAEAVRRAVRAPTDRQAHRPFGRRGRADRVHRDLLRAQPVPLRLLRRLGLGADRARHARRAARPGRSPGRPCRAGPRWSRRARSPASGSGRCSRSGWAESADQAHDRGQPLAALRRALRRARAAAARRPARHGGRRRRRRRDPRARRLHRRPDARRQRRRAVPGRPPERAARLRQRPGRLPAPGHLAADRAGRASATVRCSPAAALAGATFLGGLVLLGQTRAVVPAVAALGAAAARGRARAARGAPGRSWWPARASPPASARSSTSTTRCAAPAPRRTPSSATRRSPSCSPAVGGRRALGGCDRGGRAAGRLAAAAAPARLGAAGRWSPLVALVVALAATRRPGRQGPRRVPRLHRARQPRADASSRFTSGGGNRYDYWRVAVDQFADDPLRGVGAGNYDRTYFLERRTTEDIRQPHSIELQTLGELGIVGGALLAVFLVAIAVGLRAARARGHERPPRSRSRGGGRGHLRRLARPHERRLAPPDSRADRHRAVLGRRAGRPVGTFARGRARKRPDRDRRWCAAWLCWSARSSWVAPLWRIATSTRGATSSRSDPAEAIVKAKDSQRLNDERLQAYYLESAAWARLGDYPRARAALAEATRREPHDFVTWALLGDLATRREEDRQALADYRRALALNPRDPSAPGSRAASTGASENRVGRTGMLRTSDHGGGSDRHLPGW